MDEAPLGWRWVEKADCYGCMCGFKVDYASQCKYHISDDVRGGYCENGFRALSETHYECICGKVFDTMNLAWRHRVQVFDTCMNTARYKERSYCSKCDLQLKFPHDLVRHNTSKRHMEADGPILKDLYCESCNVQTHTQKQMKAHLETKKHKQILEHGKIDLRCEICDITCQGQKQMLAHLETKKHKKLLTNHTA